MHLLYAFSNSKSEDQIEQIARKNLHHMAESITELLWWQKRSPRLLKLHINAEGTEHIHNAMARRKGVIGLTSHLGNWELLGAYISQFVVPISVIAEPVFDARVNEILVNIRHHLGVNTIYRKQSARSILGILRSGGFLGMLADQDIPTSESIFVNFFGKPALTPIGPAAISLKTGAPLVPMFIRRLPNGHHLITIEKEIAYSPCGDINQDIKELTQLWSYVVERYIRATPDQWVWLHDRFATKPKAVQP